MGNGPRNPVLFLPASRFWDMRPIAGIVRARQSRRVVYSGSRFSPVFVSGVGTVARVSEAGGSPDATSAPLLEQKHICIRRSLAV